MQSFRNPWWLFVISFLPVAILCWILYGTFQLIESQLSAENILYWQRFGRLLGLLWTLHVAYAITLIVERKKLDIWYSILTLLVYAPLLYLYFTFYRDMIPFYIPDWMISENLTLYAGSFVMPTLIHCLLVLVLCTTPQISDRKPWASFLWAIGIPIMWYLFFHLLAPLWRHVPIRSEHVLIVLLLTSTVVFLYFVMRGVYILGTKQQAFFVKTQLIWRLLFALAFPLAGLLVNSDLMFDCLFGNFTDPWFYGLAIANGIAVCLPELKHRYYRMVLFALRSALFTYILYFFMVFIPYLPLSVIAIVGFGLGFLMLTPTILLVFQTRILVTDFTFLYRHYPRRVVLALFVASVLIIPVAVTGVYVQDKQVLQRALTYVYEADYLQDDVLPVNLSSLKRVLKRIKTHKTSRWGDDQIPFLTAYYNWITLDNLTLSSKKIAHLEQVFLDVPPAVPDPSIRIEPTALDTDEGVLPGITDTHTASQFYTDGQYWVSTIDLAITNPSSRQAEYTSSFALPAGSWIQDYYLMIDGEKVPGILAEKKAATWIYQQVTSYRRDPGILYYTHADRVGFRVFPFAADETRYTGFTLIHKEPIDLQLDGQLLHLGPEGATTPAVMEVQSADHGSTVYIPAAVKQQLPVVKRKPHYYFMLDCSEKNAGQVTALCQRIKRLQYAQPVSNRCSYVLTDAYPRIYDQGTDLANTVAQHTGTGGFFLDRAIQAVLLQAYLKNDQEYPVLVAVTPALSTAILDDDYAAWQTTFPESDLFYVLEIDGTLTPYSLLAPDKPTKKEVSYPVVAWPDNAHPQIYLRLDGQASVVHLPADGHTTFHVVEPTPWLQALALQGQWLQHVFYPQYTPTDWPALIKESFTTHTMTPVTSFLSLENEAQRKALLKKQEEVLHSSKSLDIEEEDRMSEPGLLVLLLLVAPAVFYYQRHRLSTS